MPVLGREDQGTPPVRRALLGVRALRQQRSHSRAIAALRGMQQRVRSREREEAAAVRHETHRGRVLGESWSVYR